MAMPGFFIDSQSSSLRSSGGLFTWRCPAKAVCDGKRQLPRPIEGYWVDREQVAYASLVYRCRRATCKGASDDEENDNTNHGESATRTRRLSTSSNITSNITSSSSSSSSSVGGSSGGGCWSVDSHNATWCNADRLLCRRGSTGPLCGSCLDQFTFNSALSACVEVSKSLPCISSIMSISVLIALVTASTFYTYLLELPCDNLF